ncbi:MAG: alpha/beta hydrolase [Bacillota bacterium]|nr:alpha/beta hydrolase [Bacillota bacterium]
MVKTLMKIDNIPAILWGEKSDNIYIFVHGKMSCKEEAEEFVALAAEKDFQVLSFDLPEHGERKNDDYPCDVWNGIHDLNTIWNYVKKYWSNICLYANSLGAYFSLLAYSNYPIKNCLFLSPILDMERLIQNMMKWFGVSEETLKDKKKVQTPMGEILDWDYYCYVREHPITKWDIPTAILYGVKDVLTERNVIDDFVKRFNADLTVHNSEHYFHTEQQLSFLRHWEEKNISRGI